MKLSYELHCSLALADAERDYLNIDFFSEMMALTQKRIDMICFSERDNFFLHPSATFSLRVIFVFPIPMINI